MDFDVQPRSSSSPKDLLRIQRDKKNLTVTKNKMMESISIDDEAHAPSKDDTMDFSEDSTGLMISAMMTMKTIRLI